MVVVVVEVEVVAVLPLPVPLPMPLTTSTITSVELHLLSNGMAGSNRSWLHFQCKININIFFLLWVLVVMWHDRHHPLAIILCGVLKSCKRWLRVVGWQGHKGN